ncbi:MAG TPA: haloacid dehalogenase type II [Polyangiaceae bacterium]|nr:haloacid dehalogenase type II [Polyangiaceae bacterium]
MMRRGFLRLAGSAVLAGACAPATRSLTHAKTAATEQRAIAAVAFDLFTVFDVRGIDRRVVAVLGEGPLAATWKARLFEYSWLRAVSGNYVDFERLVHDSLSFAARTHGVTLSEPTRKQLESAFVELEPWPDSVVTLRELRARGLRLAPLANFAPRMIESLLRHADLHDAFDAFISTDLARTYKPDPKAYALGESVLGLPRERIAFAAFGGWDAVGGSWFGYPTFWVNRLGTSSEELGASISSGPDLRAFSAWLSRYESEHAGRVNLGRISVAGVGEGAVLVAGEGDPVGLHDDRVKLVVPRPGSNFDSNRWSIERR